MLELYQQVILDHNKQPRNFKKLEHITHQAEGFNPMCGDRYTIYLNVDQKGTIKDIAFEGEGCAISKASASMMTNSLKGKSIDEAHQQFNEFHQLIIGTLDPQGDQHQLGKLKIFSHIKNYPSRVKCAGLSWHAFKEAIERNSI